MGFLNDLKRQADALRAERIEQVTDVRQSAALVEDILHGVLEYYVTLIEQLNVLQPASKARFEVDRRHAFDGFKLTDFYVDARRKKLRNEEVLDVIVLHWQAKTGQKVEITKDFITEWQRLETKLRHGGVAVNSESVRDENSRLQEMRYTFTADFRGSVHLTPLHDEGNIQFQLKNMDSLETITFDLPAEQVIEARMDELARWLVGQPHNFLKDVLHLRVIEA